MKDTNDELVRQFNKERKVYDDAKHISILIQEHLIHRGNLPDEWNHELTTEMRDIIIKELSR